VTKFFVKENIFSVLHTLDTIENSDNTSYKFGFGQKLNLIYVCPGQCLLYIMQESKVKVKVIPKQAEVAQGFPDRLKSRIFLTFGTTRVVGHQPYSPAAFNPGEIPGTHFQGLSRPQGT
jgi:hypothetical protein